MTSWMPRLPRVPTITIQRLTIALVILIVGYWILAGLTLFAVFSLYLTFLVVTVLVVRSVPVQPGRWLAVRSLRRSLVAVIALGFVVLLLGPSGPDSIGGEPILLLLLGLGFVILGRATQRVASAPDAQVDERQEALRNRSHRIAYWIFSLVVGATLLLSYTLSTASRVWLGDALHGTPFITFFLLLFFLPAMVLAWLEPDRLSSEDSPRLATTARSRLALAMVAVALLTPIVLSLALLIGPDRTTSTVVSQSTEDPHLNCSYFEARTNVGFGFGAVIPLSAEACWDGRRASETWGLNASDCHPNRTEETIVDTIECSRTSGADGTLRFVYHSRVRSAILPFISRDVIMRLALTGDGKVLTFP